MARIAKLTLAVGKKGVGKTYSLMQLIRQYVKSVGGGKGSKVLVYDVNKEYVEIKTLALKDLLRFVTSPKPEARRILPIHDDGTPMSTIEMQQTLFFILRYVYNLMLVIEDLNAYIGHSISEKLIALLAVQRHKSVDTFIHFQAKNRSLNPTLLGQTNMIRIFKTTDTYQQFENRTAGHSEILILAETLVDIKYKTDIHWNCWVDFDSDIIHGDYTLAEFKEAITVFVSGNERTTLLPILNRKDREGNKIYNYKQALEIIEQELIDRYYQYKKK